MSREGRTADEKALENKLCKMISSGSLGCGSIRISTPKAACTLLDLLGKNTPDIVEDDSNWNKHKSLSLDLFHGITPDIVFRSRLSNENRIIIEVKKNSSFTHKELDASQVLRYFLHLLATTNKKFKDEKDLQRAVLLAAPSQWFRGEHAKPWDHFLAHYGPLASQFCIILGSIDLDFLL